MANKVEYIFGSAYKSSIPIHLVLLLVGATSSKKA